MVRWTDLSLAQSFALAGGLVMVLAGLAVGFLVADRIEATVVRNTANTTALYMQSFVAPYVQDLEGRDDLPPNDLSRIEGLLKSTPLGQRVVSFKVWQKGGLVIGASNPDIVGKTFPAAENLQLAWNGEVQASFDDLGRGLEAEDTAEAKLGVPLLEIYAPVRSMATGQILCVVEFYEVATQLRSDLARAVFTAWAVVALIVMAVGASLFAIVLRGSRTIQAQVVSLTDLSARNVALRRKIQDGARRFADQTDQTLKRIGADLHDGPAQQIGFAALRLDALRGQLAAADKGAADLDEIDQALREAIAEIRNISRGLSLPDIDKKPLSALVQSLVEAHEARARAEVRLDMRIDRDPTPPVKTLVCRAVQEGLTNAWRHGRGMEQSVQLQVEGRWLALAVRDRGPGPLQGAIPGASSSDPASGLGLAGLQGRAEALGGAVALGPRRDGPGAELTLELELEEIPG